jgi:hypothetical protein
MDHGGPLRLPQPDLSGSDISSIMNSKRVRLVGYKNSMSRENMLRRNIRQYSKMRIAGEMIVFVGIVVKIDAPHCRM